MNKKLNYYIQFYISIYNIYNKIDLNKLKYLLLPYLIKNENGNNYNGDIFKNKFQ
jgi:hypothetical protein